MTSTGSVTINVPAGSVSDALGNTNTAYSGTGNTVSFVLSQTPTFTLTEPTGGSYSIGQGVEIAWAGSNLITGTTISLYYGTNPQGTGSRQLIATVPATVTTPAGASFGYGTYDWAVSTTQPGTYYISGTLNSGGEISSHLATPITILGSSLDLMTPTPVSYTAGQSVNIGWIADGVPASGGATVNLYYTTDTSGRNEVLIGSQPISTNGADMYTWNTTDVPGGTYYIAATLTSGGTTVGPYFTKSITVAGPADPPTSTSGPTVGEVGVFISHGYISWNEVDANGVAGGQLSIDGQATGITMSGPYAAASGVNYAGAFGKLSAGVHSYLITATNRFGSVSVTSGSFTVPVAVGPTISAVGVNLADNSITWNEADANGVAGAQLSIDGQALGAGAVSGPYSAPSGVNYAANFGTLAAGTYTYVITATNDLGYSSQQSGQFTVTAASANSSAAGGSGSAAGGNGGVTETPAEVARAAIRAAALEALTSLASQSGKAAWGYT
jgi:hypothetical protein